MRRLFAFGLAWVAAAAVAVAVAWQGVGVIGSQVTDDRAAPLSAAEVRAAVELSSDEPGRTTSTPTSAAGPGPTVSAPTSRTTAPPAGVETTAAGTTKTYRVQGGTVALRFSPSGVTFLWATPNAGFDVEQDPEHGNGVKVEFRSETHRSRVDGWWDGGPQDEVREEAD